MRQKLKRYQENAQHPRLWEDGKEGYGQLAGRWHREVFGNQGPITLELACGRGEYTVGLAEHRPDGNFIGVDIKGDRLWKGLQAADAKGLDNVAFLRTYMHQLGRFFQAGEVHELWLTFPDPRPRRRDAKRRLTHPRYLDIYRQVMGGVGTVHLKTDNNGLFAYTLEQLLRRDDVALEAHTWHLEASPLAADHLGITTRYERLFSAKGLRMNYLRFSWQ